MTVTLADVAKACGLSPSTVSRALSDPGRVSAQTRDKVARVAREMGYTPNRVARSLSMGRTGTIGLIVPDVANPFFPPIIKAVQARAARKDLVVVLADTDERAADELDRARVLSKQVDGLIMVSPRSPEPRIAEIGRLGPTVFVNRRVPEHPSVLIDNADGMRQAVEHLVALGHRHIGYLAGPRRSWSNQQRHAAITEACAQLGAELVTFGPFEPQVQAGVQAADLLQGSPATAVIAYDDLIALGVMARMSERGLSVGRDLSVMGIDDSPLSGMAYPTLTSIHVPGAEAGATAVDLLLDVLDGLHGEPPPPLVELETYLVVRSSTGPAPRR
ncbi:LacI family DNA-binding transcriptional regulator [Nonomuraea spiralis]|uniref:LacI family DNA-binding transcriptional regulator n=1 Tax=Nonomuraea spiralis TaxID=46182 RepID=A0ABV5J0E0_9ACTN|nr:LacI family DNA-binding transcriptional regulator [Nonomuraea spiralis]GGS89505.1 LacI family transcriptional regulator [Nonomuraea spiralis]